MIDFLLRPIRRNFGRDRVYYRIVDDLFGFIPHNVELYKLALIHKSASLVLEDGRAINNERLEYLGDAVIEAATSDELTESESDFKSRLIEWSQKNRHQVEFRTEHDKEYASNHPVFYCTVLVDGMEVGHGAGDSKKEAEQRAAFSVSQYMSDEQCASLLDKVDRLEGTRSGSGF